MARLRLVIVPALLALCLCACFAGAASASGATHRRAHHSHRTSRAAHRRAHHSRCARPSSFHSSGGHARHKRRGKRCLKRHSTKRHFGHKHHRRHSRHAPIAANSASCPGAEEKPTQENIETIRTATLCLIDQERTSHGEASLQPNGQLQQAAQAHTESMAFGGYFEHDGPRGDTPLSRMLAAGYIYSSQVGYEVGENIGWGTLWLATPRAIVAAWMASPGHRANILDAHFRDSAIGVSPHLPSSLGQSQAGAIYTQDFGVITR